MEIPFWLLVAVGICINPPAIVIIIRNMLSFFKNEGVYADELECTFIVAFVFYWCFVFLS